MAIALELCVPCQSAIRSGRAATILGPRHRIEFQFDQCALCMRVAAIRGLYIDGLPNGFVARAWLQLSTRFQRGFQLPRQVVIEHLAPPPHPPINNQADILLTSPHIRHTRCQFRAETQLRLKKSSLVPDTTYLRAIPKHSIDRALVWSWLTYCESNHGPCNLAPPNNGLQLLLIDVERNCLVSTSNARYFALSYVWGGAAQVQLKEADLEGLQREGSLRGIWKTMPPVVKSAMAFLKGLGETYLWVDALCIVQDSPGRHTYLAKMNEIYSGAVCTIVAMEGQSADSELPGVMPNTRILNPLFENMNYTIARRRSDLASACASSAYEGRGWTFQERVLSPRCLYFTNEQLFFHCREAVWSEDRLECFDQDFGAERILPSVYSIGHKPDTDWLERYRAYADLVEQYSGKALTYPTDRLNAFAGVISSLGDAWSWKFMAGLPLPLLDLALMWTSNSPAPQRVIVDDANMYLPSWSWAGWLDGIQHYIFASKVSHWDTEPFQGHSSPFVRSFGITTQEGVVVVEVAIYRMNMLSFETLRQEQPSLSRIAEEHTRLDILPLSLHGLPNVLIFWAESVPYRKLSTCRTSRYSGRRHGNLDVPLKHVRRIFGAGGSAGLLLHSAPLTPLPVDDYQYILLSESSSGPCIKSLDDYINATNEELESDFAVPNIYNKTYSHGPRGGLDSSAIFNIMLVKMTRRGCFERVAVGQIHPRAWYSAGPVKRKIYLG